MLRTILDKASKHHIPTGVKKQAIPYLPEEGATLIKEREALRKIDHFTGAQKSQQPQKVLPEKKGQMERVCQIEFRLPHRQQQNLENNKKNLDNKQVRTCKEGAHQIKTCHKEKTFQLPLKNSKALQQFTIPERHQTANSYRQMNKDIRKRPLIYAIRITPAQVKDSIRQARNSKVVGPGGVSMVHLKHIVPHGTRALADTFTASHATSTIPTVWKKSISLPS